MPLLVLVRHGQSLWNLENRFTGWIDVPLTEMGMKEAEEAGKKIHFAGIHIDEAFTSVLKRAQDTLTICLKAAGQQGVPTHFDQAINERHYGDLQGLNKAETAASLRNLGIVTMNRGQLAEAEAYLEESVSLMRELGNASPIHTALLYLGWARYFGARTEESQVMWEEALVLARGYGDRFNEGAVLTGLGLLTR